MHFEFTPYALPMLVGTAILFPTAIYAARRRSTPGGLHIALVLLAQNVWMFASALEAFGADLATTVWMGKFSYLGIATVGPLLFASALAISDRSAWLTRNRVLAVGVIPALTIVLVFTNEYHHLIWKSLVLDDDAPFVTTVSEWGPAFWLNLAFSYLTIMAAAALLIQLYIGTWRQRRTEALVVLPAVAAPWLANIVHVFGMNPFPFLDTTVIAMSATGPALAFAVLRGSVPNILPVAQSRLFDELDECVLVTDCEHRILQVNQPARDMLALLGSKSEIGGTLRFADRYAALFRPLTEGAEKSVPIEIETDRGSIHFLARSSPLDRRGRGVGRLIVIRDVSERERSTARLHHALEEAEAASRAKSMFLATMSHEIRTPLSGVVGMASLLEQEELPEDVAERLRALRRSGELLQALVNNVLDFSKAEAGELVLDDAPFDLRQVIDDAIGILGSAADEKGLELSASHDPGCPRFFAGDALRIRQVLLNLMSNAIKFTKCGSVEIYVECLESDEDSARVRFRVVDTGIGIADDRLESVFSVFTQADEATTREYGGSGLGLAIVRQLVDAMEGDVSVESVPGSGSTFCVDLRLARSAGVTKGESEPLRGKDLDLHVLLAEDDPVNQIVSKALLESIGCSVDVAGNGADAVAMVGSRTYDAVLMDCRMPDVDGYQATREIRSMPGAPSRVPIVALTANATTEDRDRCLAAGMNGYVTKPVQAGGLRAALEQAIGRVG